MFTLAFLKATLERAVRTAAQAAVGLVAGDGLGVLDVDWGVVGSVSGLAAIVSVLMSVAAGAVSPSTGPSFGTEVPSDPATREVN